MIIFKHNLFIFSFRDEEHEKNRLTLFYRLLLIVFLVSIFCFDVVMPQYSQGYMASFIDKMHKAEMTDEPKILLMGDSNVLYGIRSDMIEDALGMPVINMGMHGGLGQTICMDIAKDTVHENDIVIALPAHYSFTTGVKDANLAWLMLENHMDLWKGVNLNDYIYLVRAFPTYIRKALDLWINDLGNENNVNDLSRGERNEWGDAISSGDENVMPNGWSLENDFVKNVNSDLMDYYNDYNSIVTLRGGYFMLASPPIIEPCVEGDEDVVNIRQTQVESYIQFPFISDSKDYIFPTEYFSDTNYHLNNMGRIIRTEQLIKDIKAWMEENYNNEQF